MKIAHDPRNLSWTTDTNSYGQRLMQQQGWKAGEGLGAKDRQGKNNTDSSKVAVVYKDDTLGLGAALKSKDVQNQRTGLDAFQGLLGRLNAKDEAEVKAVEKKIEDKKLAMYTQGRWGGMVFVPGGLLVQGEKYKSKEQEQEPAETSESPEDHDRHPAVRTEADTEIQRKTEKRKRKEERRQRKEEKRLKKLAKAQAKQKIDPVPDLQSADDDVSADEEEEVAVTANGLSKKRRQSTEASDVAVKVVKQAMKNGRHILRGRNIQAKRAAFADTKMLDEIFMVRT